MLADIQPSGRFLMEDLHYAGGMPAVLKEIAPLLDLDAMTISGEPLRNAVMEAECFNREVIGTLDKPVCKDAGIWVLRGNLSPNGAIIKPSAASKHLFRHRGRAVVFEFIEDFKTRIDDDNLDVDENSILVLKGCGPKGYPGMPEVGNMPLPKKLLVRGIKDMVRISDARMSGTAYGTVILHVSPESEAGGPLAVVHNGDEIVFDGEARKLDLLIGERELQARLAAWKAAKPPSKYTRGYYRLHIEHVLQADLGCDLDFLAGGSGSDVDRELH